jgi:hypothetical protein
MDNKIARMEAKLAQLASSPEVPGGDSQVSATPAPHPSLPAKPSAASIMAADQSSALPPTKKQKVGGVGQRSGPTLELARRAAALVKADQRGHDSPTPPAAPTSGSKASEVKPNPAAGRAKVGIAGVKIVKKKKVATDIASATPTGPDALSNSSPESS